MAKVNGLNGTAGLRGRLGNIVYVQGRDGETIAREYTLPRNPHTPKQTQQRTAMALAGQAWLALTPEQAQQWQAYAESLTSADPRTGQTVTPRPQNVFNRLALKIKQMNPQAAIPVAPPSQAFFGDGVPVSVAGSAGEITFTVSHANSPNVVTELLIQPLASVHRKPQADKYRSAGFVEFTAGGLSQSVTAKAGWVAVAVRFVQSQTGQASPLIALGKVNVTPP